MRAESPIKLAEAAGINKILVMKWSALGDIAISSARFADLRQAFPGAQIDLNTLPPWDRVLFADDPRFDSVFAIDLRGRERGLRGVTRWLQRVAGEGYDLIVDLQTNSRSRLLLSLLTLLGRGGRYRLSIHRRFPYNLAPEPVGSGHAFALQQRAFQYAGIPTPHQRPALVVSDTVRARAGELMRDAGLTNLSYAVFFPGSSRSGLLKRWGVERYAALADALTGFDCDRIVLIGGHEEAEDCRRIESLAKAGRVVNLCGRTDVLEIVPLCEAATVIVGNDTGTAHVAACADTPMVVICGPTDPRRVKPPGTHVVALQAELDCINCYQKECSHHRCMELIPVEKVLAAIRSLNAAE